MDVVLVSWYDGEVIDVKARGEVIDVSWIGLWVEDVRFEDYCELDWSVVWLNVCGLCDLKWVIIGDECFGWGIELIANGVNELIWIDIGMKWLIRSRMCYGEGWNWEFDVNKCVCVRELIIVGYWLCDYCVLDVWNVGEVRSMWIVSVDECCKLYYGYDVDLIGENDWKSLNVRNDWKSLNVRNDWKSCVELNGYVLADMYWFGGCDWVWFESNDWMNE